MVRPALAALVGDKVTNRKRVGAIMDAMMFVTRWCRANHMTSYRKTGKPLEDIYSKDASSPSVLGSLDAVAGASPAASSGSEESPISIAADVQTKSKSKRKRKRRLTFRQAASDSDTSPCSQSSLDGQTSPSICRTSPSSQRISSPASAFTPTSSQSSSCSGYETPETLPLDNYSPGTSPPNRKRKRKRKDRIREGSRQLSRCLTFNESHEKVQLVKVKQEPQTKRENNMQLLKVKVEPDVQLLKVIQPPPVYDLTNSSDGESCSESTMGYGSGSSSYDYFSDHGMSMDFEEESQMTNVDFEDESQAPSPINVEHES